MDRRLLASLIGCVLIASACSAAAEEDAADESEEQSTTDPSDDRSDDGEGGDEDADGGDTEDSDGVTRGPGTTEEPFEPSITGEALGARLSELEGRLAIGNGPEVAVVRPDGFTLEVLDGSESIFASQPTWSHDGKKLAWSSVSAERQIVQVQEFGEDGVLAGEPLRSNAEGVPIFYLQWNESDEQLAYIRNAPSGGVVEVGRFEPGRPVEPTGEGAPFFISWSPAPDRILGHVNEQSMDLLDVEASGASGFETVLGVDGGFSAPAWTDERRALIVAGGALSYLDVATGEVEAIEQLDGPVQFVLSPDRTKVAYQLIGGSGGSEVISLPVGETGSNLQPAQNAEPGLTVLNLLTAERTPVTTDLALAWEWSPDSDKLAWLGADLATAQASGQWNFWSADEPLSTVQSSAFGLTRKYGQAYLPFFAQYAQSVTGWSPDSTAFAFAGRIGGDRGVWIQLVDEVVAPQLVAAGDFVTWGPGQAPPAVGNAASAA